jgi:hypothetical protein
MIPLPHPVKEIHPGQFYDQSAVHDGAENKKNLETLLASNRLSSREDSFHDPDYGMSLLFDNRSTKPRTPKP